MDNQLQVIVEGSGLEKTKAQFILDKFTNYFEIAADWENKAKTIVVSSEKDKTEMQMARVGRLFLREKRIDIEKARVSLKEQALREGKAIDGIANILKSLIVPIEEYLERQEKFVEIKQKEAAEIKRLEDEANAEKERLALEEAQRKEQERIRLENIKLKEEVEIKEKKMIEEREKAEMLQKKMEEKALQEKTKAEAKLRAEKEANEKAQEEQRLKAEAEKARMEKLARIEKEKADKIIAEQREQARKAQEKQERIQKLLDAQIECPFCHKKFTK